MLVAATKTARLGMVPAIASTATPLWLPRTSATEVAA